MLKLNLSDDFCINNGNKQVLISSQCQPLTLYGVFVINVINNRERLLSHPVADVQKLEHSTIHENTSFYFCGRQIILSFLCGKYFTNHYLLSDLHGTKITVIVIPKCCFRNVVKNIRNYCLKIGTVTWETTLPKLMKTIQFIGLHLC